MIDVVFLLLVFSMLASRFGVDAILRLPLASKGGEYSGLPRLIDVSPEGVALNGVPTTDLLTALAPLMTDPSDMLILRGTDGATLQRIVSINEELHAAGLTSVVLVE